VWENYLLLLYDRKDDRVSKVLIFPIPFFHYGCSKAISRAKGQGSVEGLHLPPTGTTMDDSLCRWKATIFQNHLINNLSTEDASPPPKVLVGAEEFFVDHLALTTITLHGALLFCSHFSSHSQLNP